MKSQDDNWVDMESVMFKYLSIDKENVMFKYLSIGQDNLDVESNTCFQCNTDKYSRYLYIITWFKVFGTWLTMWLLEIPRISRRT